MAKTQSGMHVGHSVPPAGCFAQGVVPQEQVYQCIFPVGYRCSPKNADTNDAAVGPVPSEVVIGTCIAQGPEAIFIQCSSGCGWLPYSDPSGSRILFKYLGKKSELDMRQYKLCAALGTDASAGVTFESSTILEEQEESDEEYLPLIRPTSYVEIDVAPEQEEQVYQCLLSSPGVGYRRSLNLTDKNAAALGPTAPDVVVSTRVVQGAEGMFIQCCSGAGWLPLRDAASHKMLFKHLGAKVDLDIQYRQLRAPMPMSAILEASIRRSLPGLESPDSSFSDAADDVWEEASSFGEGSNATPPTRRQIDQLRGTDEARLVPLVILVLFR